MNKKEFLSHTNDYLNETFTLLLEKAYDAGYEQGARTLQKNTKSDITWVDLGLPSGKLWGFKDITPHKCEDINAIPSLFDYRELYCNTTFRLDNYFIGQTKYWACYFIGRTGATLCVKVWKQEEEPKDIDLYFFVGNVKDGVINDALYIRKRNGGPFYILDNNRISPDSTSGINLYVI